MTSKRHLTDADTTSLHRFDVNSTLLSCHEPAGIRLKKNKTS